MMPVQNPQRAARSQEAGFTLLEVLLALGLLTSIIVVAIGLISRQMEMRTSTTEITESQHAVNTAMTQIHDDLSHAYIISKINLADAQVGSASRTFTPFFRKKSVDSSISFVTQNYRSFMENSPQSNLATVRYFIRQDPDSPGRQMLVRRFDTNLSENLERDDVGVDQVLVNDLKTFEVLLWSGADWVPDWDSTSATERNMLPKMARIRIETYAPLSEQQRARQDSGNLEGRREFNLTTVVYLRYSVDQEDVRGKPSREYRWQ